MIHMIKHSVGLLLGILGLLLVAHGEPMARAQGPPLSEEYVAENGIEVLTRGPIHEAFAIPLTVNARANPIISEKPPAAIEELAPDQKPEGTHIQWIPGYFAWDETGDDYIWISGLWRDTPPGRQWMPGHWADAPGEADGWQWVSGYWAVEDQGEVEYLPPPPASLDVGPSTDAPDADSFYSPGCWVYRDRRYAWRPGFWQRSRADWYYAPAHYSWTPAGYIFSDGYWDYPLARRGLMFAPVRFGVEAYGRQDWHYQPRYVIGYQGLLGSMFARAEYGRYYSGDYYGQEYNRHGFVPWFDYRVGRNGPDPLFHHSRWQSRNDPRWEPNLRTSYQDRRAGIAPRPPTTLVQQHQVIQNITINKTVKTSTKTLNVTNHQNVLQQMSVVAPFTKGTHNDFKLSPVAKATQAEQRQAVKHLQAAALERQTREAKLVSGGVHTDASTKVKVQIPKVARPAKSLAQAPPPPALPKHVDKPMPKSEVVAPLRVDSPKGKGKGPAQIQGTPKAKELDAPAPKGKEKDNPPPKGKKANPTPSEAKEKDNPPSKGKKADPTRLVSKEKGNPPPKGKKADPTLPEAKEKDNPPPKAKEQKKPRKDAELQTSSIRELVGLETAAGLGRLLSVAVFDVKEAKTARKAADHEYHETYAKCAKMCAACQLECDACFHRCAQRVGDGSKEHAKSMRLCVDCAELCSTAARLTARHSVLSAAACEACAKGCDLCAISCEQVGADKSMAACARICRECAKECRTMMNHSTRSP